MLKNTQQSGNRRSIPQHNKGHIPETYSQHHTQLAKLKTFLLRSGTRQGCPLSPLLFNIVLEVLATVIRQEEIKDIQIGKEEVNLSFFANMMLYIENPTGSTKKLLDLINEFGKVAGYKITIQKPMAFLYNNNDTSEIETEGEKSHLLLQQKNKVCGNKFNQGGKRPILEKL